MDMMMTTGEAAEVLRVTAQRVVRLIHAGRFPGARMAGRDWLLPRSAVLAHRRLPPGRPRKARVAQEAP